MLVLTRKPGEAIQIGPSIVVELVSMSRYAAYLKISYPDGVSEQRLLRYESVDLSPGISISIPDIQRGQLRIGITAPREVKVVRTELLSEENPFDGRHTGYPHEDSGETPA